MLEVMKCLAVENGFICLIDGDYEKSIEDLKDEVAGLTIRLEKLNTEVEAVNEQIKTKKNLDF